MTAKLLEKHITDTIREWQVKIGYEGGTMKLYYPAESLRRSLSLDETEDLAKALAAFCKNVQYTWILHLSEHRLVMIMETVVVSVEKQIAEYCPMRW